jgi:ATP-dependent Clp protease protease subunit
MTRRKPTQSIIDQGRRHFDSMVEARVHERPLSEHMDRPSLDMLSRMVGASPPPMAIRTIPTVTEIGAGGRERGWDIYSLLMKNRIIMLEEVVDPTMSSIAIASILYLDSEFSGNNQEKPDPISMYINSPGGYVTEGLAIYDTMRFIKSPVHTTGFGQQSSMGSLLLIAGERRMLTENSRVMIHQVSGGASGQHSEVATREGEISRLHEQLKSLYVRHTGLNHKYWNKVAERDTYVTPAQALKIGLVDGIVPASPGKRTLHEEFAFRTDIQSSRELEVPQTKAELIEIMNDLSADGGRWARLRPELATALSQYSEFWTPSRAKMEEAKKAAVSSNDNKGSAPK